MAKCSEACEHTCGSEMTLVRFCEKTCYSAMSVAIPQNIGHESGSAGTHCEQHAEHHRRQHGAAATAGRATDFVRSFACSKVMSRV